MKIFLRILIGLVVTLILTVLITAYSSEAPKVMATVTHDPSLPRIKVGGILLHSESFGDPKNPMIIVLHGGPGSDYRSLLPLKELSDAFYIVFYDQRGSGLSERVDSSLLTVEGFRQELKAVIEHYQSGQDIYLLGHSWGGMLASSFVGHHGEIIKKAILIEPGFLNSETLTEVMKRTNGFQPKNPSLGMGMRILRDVIRSMRIDGPDDAARMDFIVSSIMFSSNTESPIAGYFCGADTNNGKLENWRFGGACAMLLAGLADPENAATFNLTEGLDKFTKPVLLMAGACNTLIGPDIQERHSKLFPNARLEILENAGHTLIGERPKESIAIIRRFLIE